MSRTVNYAVVYRPPPSNVNNLTTTGFLSDFEDFIDHLNLNPGKPVLLGDFNVHFDCPDKQDVARFIRILSSSGLSQHVSGPTHRRGHTLDLVISRSSEGIVHSTRVIDSRMSDHAVIAIDVNLPKPPSLRTSMQRRKFGTIDHDIFEADLLNRLSDVHFEGNIDLLVQQIDMVTTEVLDRHAPLSTCSSRVRHRPRWYNAAVDDARRQRRRSERKWRKSKTNDDLVQYEMAQEMVRSTVCEAKKDYLKESLSSNSPREVFSSINMLLNRNEHVLPDTSSSCKLANAFCRYFTSKIKNIRRLIDDQNAAPLDNSASGPDPPCELSQFCTLTEEEVLKLIKRSSSKSSPADPLPTWLLKRHISSFLPTLTELINASLSTGTFPAALGSAVITPVLKKPSLDKNNLQNYRPVSNIRYYGKLIESAVSVQLTKHIESNGLSDPMQSAYRAGYSTETALLRLQNYICTSLDHQNAVGLISLDLSAAFDTVDKGILLKRLEESFGITGCALHWFSSYFQSRKYHVRVNGAQSNVEDLKFGIPQGSLHHTCQTS
ncbi:uncharacterized protein LOC121417647 [Lytechinus variegatus]|uniref:uncharacterized protein LOC121417647 n=1 Tax=Lytechinus variegatus TaxID=7654 RepID=UPI001BB23EFE|nr:uncharacterized protein LOC121417647 [Lytechinus variegatus]